MKMYDVIIKNGIIADPLHRNLESGNIGIIGKKIAVISKDPLAGKKEIDAGGHIVSPGFIDVHAHLDGNTDAAWASARQGITTTIGGNCGISPLDMKDFISKMKDSRYPIHQAELVGQSFTVRQAVGLLDPYAPATIEQIAKMCVLVDEALSSGAIGVSMGLEYVPGSSWEEILAISHIAAKHHKVVPIHTNLSNAYDLEHLEEVIRLAEETGAHIHIAHFVYQYMSLMDEALGLVDKARDRGLNISVDSGLYTSFATFIGSRVYDREHLKSFGWKFSDLLITTGKYTGERLNETLYEQLRKTAYQETCICFTGHEEDIYKAYEKDYVMVSTDSGENPFSHPQALGSYPRFFRKLVRERKQLTLFDAIRRCTYLPAKAFELKNKGRLLVGFDADIVIFDIDTITDCADFYGLGDYFAAPKGIDYVFVGGEVIVDHGEAKKDVLPGEMITY